MKTIIILTLLVAVAGGCNRIDKETYEKEKERWELQTDSLTASAPFLFEKALQLEASDREAAISIYKQLADSSSGSFWSVEAEARILSLSEDEIINSWLSPNADFSWFIGDTLELYQQNEKCGEWGGDVERITVFWKLRELVASYTKEVYDCDSLMIYILGITPDSTYKSAEKALTSRQTVLLKETIISLAEHRINNNNIGMSGIVNVVQISKGGRFEYFCIRDYPSFRWNKFHQLKNELWNIKTD